MLKICTKCGREQSGDCFSKKKSSPDGLRTYCKECAYQYNKKYSQKYSDEISSYQKIYRAKHKEEMLQHAKRFRQRHRAELLEKQRERRNLPAEKTKAKEYYQKNRHRILSRRQQPEVKARIKTYEKKWNRQPKQRIRRSVSNYLSKCLKGKKAGLHWEYVLGYSLQQLIEHLENNFQPGMTWENYGEWEIDHICPVRLFHFADIDDPEVRKCWSLSNLQPLWKTDNRRKGGTFQ